MPTVDGMRIEAGCDPGARLRDRAQTARHHRRTSARREGKPAGWPAPAA
jgi:hypothetical protein